VQLQHLHALIPFTFLTQEFTSLVRSFMHLYYSFSHMFSVVSGMYSFEYCLCGVLLWQSAY